MKIKRTETMRDEKTVNFASLIEKSAEAGTLVSVVFHSPEKGERLKAKGKIRSVGGKTVLQIETSLTEGRVSQEIVALDEILSRVPEFFNTYKKADLTDKNGSAALMISKKGAVTLIKKGKIGEKMPDNGVGISENNRIKNHLLTGGEKFLYELGISDENGRVHDKKQSKFRQIC